MTSNHASKLVKQTLIDQYTQSWHGQLNLSSKGFNYKLFKDSIIFESYLTLLPKQHYIPILKFRTANHFFVIETSRWLNRRIPLENRKCDKCNKNDLGDEYHYLQVCPYFKNKRDNLIPEYFHKRPNVIKFKELLNTKSVTLLEQLSHFIRILLKIKS